MVRPGAGGNVGFEKKKEGAKKGKNKKKKEKKSCGYISKISVLGLEGCAVPSI